MRVSNVCVREFRTNAGESFDRMRERVSNKWEPLSTACCGYGSGDTGLPVVPHHGVAVRTQGVLCVTGLGYATTGPRFGPGPVSWKPPSRGNPQTTACCGGGSCGKLSKKGPSCDFSTNARVSFERMRERVSNECVRESFARMEIVGF